MNEVGAARTHVHLRVVAQANHQFLRCVRATAPTFGLVFGRGAVGVMGWSSAHWFSVRRGLWKPQLQRHHYRLQLGDADGELKTLLRRGFTSRG